MQKSLVLVVTIVAVILIGNVGGAYAQNGVPPAQPGTGVCPYGYTCPYSGTLPYGGGGWMMGGAYGGGWMRGGAYGGGWMRGGAYGGSYGATPYGGSYGTGTLPYGGGYGMMGGHGYHH